MAAAQPMDEARLLAMLARLAGEPDSTVYVQPPVSKAAIADMQGAARRDLAEAVPDGYVALLRLSNGVGINGAYVKEAENLVPENLDVPRAAVIVLGHQGNVSDYVFDRRDRRFHIVAMGAEDERLASFETFAEMLLAVMKDERVL